MVELFLLIICFVGACLITGETANHFKTRKESAVHKDRFRYALLAAGMLWGAVYGLAHMVFGL